MPATNTRDDALVDLPLCIGTTGSLARVLRDGRGRRRAAAASTRSSTLPALLALGAGLAPHLSKAVFEGLRSMAGEFVRTPKQGELHSATATARAPTCRWSRSRSASLSFASVIASLETGHWFATPFAMLFTFGYGYVATLVGERAVGAAPAARLASSRSIRQRRPTARDLESLPPAARGRASEELAA